MSAGDGGGQCCSHTHAHTHTRTHTRTHTHTHTHTHTPTHTGEILGKRTLVLGACFLAICLASAGVMWGFSLRHKLTRNCDVFCDVCWKYSRYSVDHTNCTKRALIFNIKNVHIPFCALFHQSTTL